MAARIGRLPPDTLRAVDRRIEEATGAQLRRCAGNRRRIDRRLRELDEEVDLESLLDRNASVVDSLGVLVGVLVNRRLPSVPVSWTASLVQLAARGWSPLEPLLRRMGIRTSREIEIERVALGILRDDVERRPGSLGSRRFSDNGVRVVRH
ncbi:hypothetical protein [Reyranella sp.]|uniref:hypothetical protein n=1 Tax=Reyranella sp. TaxID=1929291 RepID=UPI003D0D950C